MYRMLDISDLDKIKSDVDAGVKLSSEALNVDWGTETVVTPENFEFIVLSLV